MLANNVGCKNTELFPSNVAKKITTGRSQQSYPGYQICIHNQQLEPTNKLLNSSETKPVTYVGVGMVNKHCQCRKNFANHIDGWRRILVAAQIHHDPRDIPEERQRNVRVDEGNKWLDYAEADDVITAHWAVAYTCHSHYP